VTGSKLVGGKKYQQCVARVGDKEHETCQHGARPRTHQSGGVKTSTHVESKIPNLRQVVAKTSKLEQSSLEQHLEHVEKHCAAELALLWRRRQCTAEN
jgi:hypothetical protein